MRKCEPMELHIKDPSVDLRKEQEKTLGLPRRKYGLLARTLFITMDILYGAKQTLSKFKVLEVIARVPYQSWEHVAYIAMTHTYPMPQFARRIFDFVRESRAQQDNEQWHLFIIEEMTQKTNDLFSYPNGWAGDFNEQSKRILQELGFRCALTTVIGSNNTDSDVFELKRLNLHNEGDFGGFLRTLSSFWRFLRKVRNASLLGE